MRNDHHKHTHKHEGEGWYPRLLWNDEKGRTFPGFVPKLKCGGITWHHFCPLVSRRVFYYSPFPLLFLVAPAFRASQRSFAPPLYKSVLGGTWAHHHCFLFACPGCPFVLRPSSSSRTPLHKSIPTTRSPYTKIKNIFSYARPPDRPTSIASQPRSPPKLLTWLGHPGQPSLSLSPNTLKRKRKEKESIVTLNIVFGVANSSCLA